jgi:hypothetical protein
MMGLSWHSRPCCGHSARSPFSLRAILLRWMPTDNQFRHSLPFSQN